MKNYQCHKRTMASQIVDMIQTTHHDEPERQMVSINTDDGATYTFNKDDKMFARYMPKVGDYMVLYRDGYLSISPQKEFEDGYSEIFEEVEMDAPAKFLQAMKSIADEGTQAWSGGWFSEVSDGMFFLQLDGKSIAVFVRDQTPDPAMVGTRVDELQSQGSYNSLGSIQPATEGTELKQINLRWIDRDHSKVLQYLGQVMRNDFWEEAWFDVPTALETPING